MKRRFVHGVAEKQRRNGVNRVVRFTLGSFDEISSNESFLAIFDKIAKKDSVKAEIELIFEFDFGWIFCLM